MSKPPIKGRFQPGQPRPAGAGMQKGQKTARTIEKEQYFVRVLEEMAAKSRAYAGMTVDEIMEAESFNTLVWQIHMVFNPGVEDSVKAKVLESLARKQYPDLKSVENKGEQNIRITIEGLPPPAEPLIEAPAVVNVNALTVDASPVIEQTLAEPALDPQSDEKSS